MNKGHKKLAERPSYISPNQLTLEGFETTFERKLSKEEDWVKLAHIIPWDRIVPYYDRLFRSQEGRAPINGRIIIGAMIIKHLEGLTDRSTIKNIRQNPYMQYFLGYSTFTHESPFTAPLFVEIRKRMTLELTNKISEIIATYYKEPEEEEEEEQVSTSSISVMPVATEEPTGTVAHTVQVKASSVSVTPIAAEEPAAAVANTTQVNASSISVTPVATEEATRAVANKATKEKVRSSPPNKGKMIMDATVAPQYITFPTDLKLLNAARRKSEYLLDQIYNPLLHSAPKPRTYRRIARKSFLNMSKKKVKSQKQMHKANGQQLRFLRRNLEHIRELLEAYEEFPLRHRDQIYLMVLHTVYEQQSQMYYSGEHTVADRIVSIHQPHVRPIVRGKDGKKVEFGSKLQVSLVDGYTFIDKLSWDAFNEGTCLQASVELYRKRMGFYPQQVLADKIYCTRENRKWLKEKNIRLSAKPLGRPIAEAVEDHVRPGERNPIEGKFGQGKQAYGLECIKAKLKSTSESWVASIALVLNLVNLTRRALVSLLQRVHLYWLLQKHGGSNFCPTVARVI